MASSINLNDGLKAPKSVLTNLRGVVDFGNLSQFDLYEKGYGLLAVINAPYMLSDKVQKPDSPYTSLQNQFVDILENEFRGLSGLDDMSSDSADITDGISTMQIITKVTEQSGSSITINLLREKAGRTISKYCETFLRCIKDPRSQFKTYLGAINSGNVNTVDPSFDKEVFNLLYVVTDNTGYRVEGAYIMLCAQPTQSDTSMLEAEKGSYDFVDVSLNFNAFPVRSKAINRIAQDYINNITITKDSTEMDWTLSDGGAVLKHTGTSIDGVNILNSSVRIGDNKIALE